MKIDLDKVFSSGHWNVPVRNVGEMVRELQRLPPDMPVRQGHESFVDVAVINRKTDPCVEMSEGGMWTE